MADFFEELGKKISDVASDIGKKTEDTIEIQKLKSNIRGLDVYKRQVKWTGSFSGNSIGVCVK